MQFSQIYDEESGFEACYLTRAGFIRNTWDVILVDKDPRVGLGKQLEYVLANISEEERSPYLPDRETMIDEMISDYGGASEYVKIQPESQREFFGNVTLGIFFGLLGCYGIFKNVFQGASRRKVKLLASKLLYQSTYNRYTEDKR